MFQITIVVPKFNSSMVYDPTGDMSGNGGKPLREALPGQAETETEKQTRDDTNILYIFQQKAFVKKKIDRFPNGLFQVTTVGSLLDCQ